MIIYIDNDYKCYASDGGTMRSIGTSFFDGKCPEFIAGYRFVPAGENWVREDGTAFHGEMVCPWKPYEELEKAQAAWEHEQLAVITAERDALLDDMQALIDEVLGGEENV